MSVAEGGVYHQRPDSVDSSVPLQRPASNGSSGSQQHRPMANNNSNTNNASFESAANRPMANNNASFESAAMVQSISTESGGSSLCQVAADILASVGLGPDYNDNKADLVSPWLSSELQRLFPPQAARSVLNIRACVCYKAIYTAASVGLGGGAVMQFILAIWP